MAQDQPHLHGEHVFDGEDEDPMKSKMTSPWAPSGWVSPPEIRQIDAAWWRESGGFYMSHYCAQDWVDYHKPRGFMDMINRGSREGIAAHRRFWQAEACGFPVEREGVAYDGTFDDAAMACFLIAELLEDGVLSL